jgi:hypothetical protein
MKYRVKKISEYSPVLVQLRSLYYPQVRKLGLWRYMFNNAIDRRNAIWFSNEEDAWKHIHSLQSYGKVEYFYEPPATRAANASAGY